MDEKKLSFTLRMLVVSTIAVLVYLIPINDDYADQVSLALSIIVLFFGVIWCILEYEKTFKFLGNAVARLLSKKRDKEKRKLEDDILRTVSLKEAGVMTVEDAEQRITELKGQYDRL